MKIIANRIFLALLLPTLWLLDFAPEAPFTPVLVKPAEAVVGRPLTPVSVAGVARRTTRRAVVASGSASQQQAAPTLPTGTIVSALPAGCESTVVDGVNLFNCSGTFYQPTFQSNNLVYVVK